MSHKADVLAYDREKRVYKDAYVDNFRRVRHFPALAAIGAGRSDGDSIILVQDVTPDNAHDLQHAAARNKKKIEVASRLMPTNPVDDMFASAPPLTSFRTAVMCKHTNARREAAPHSGSSSALTTSEPVSTGSTPRYSTVPDKATFKLTCPADAKSAIARTTSYDHEVYRDRRLVGRQVPSPHGKPEWSYNNPVAAKEEVKTSLYFHVAPEGVIKADRRYTQDFIDQHVEAYEVSRQQATRARQHT